MAQKIEPPSESKLQTKFIVFMVISIILFALSLVLYVCSVFEFVPEQNATISAAFAFAWFLIGGSVFAYNYYRIHNNTAEQKV